MAVSPDIYGNTLDAGTVERAVISTLQLWLPGELAHQERRMALNDQDIAWPRSWVRESEFDIDTQHPLPAVSVVSTGTTGRPEQRPDGTRATYGMVVVIVIGGRSETEARDRAALYNAAIRGALTREKSRTLGGVAEVTYWIGDDHDAGKSAGNARAAYGNAFEVTVRNVVDVQAGPDVPPPNPYVPPDLPPLPDTAAIDVVVVAGDQTP
jgi:hypothetical protein